MYSTTSGHQGISSPPSEGKKYHIRHSAVYMKSKQRVLSLFLQNGWKFKIGLLFCCYIVMTDAFKYALLAFLFAVGHKKEIKISGSTYSKQNGIAT